MTDRLASTDGGDDLEIAVQGMFAAIGYDPSTAVFSGALELDDEGYIIAETVAPAPRSRGAAAGDLSTRSTARR